MSDTPRISGRAKLLLLVILCVLSAPVISESLVFTAGSPKTLSVWPFLLGMWIVWSVWWYWRVEFTSTDAQVQD
ncbi:hypothetical protein MTYP_02659 [Methylophilaceae bacterium]|nr:hypothetical protein MTYP_02659 [Methylophilaceae bacterium]